MARRVFIYPMGLVHVLDGINPLTFSWAIPDGGYECENSIQYCRLAGRSLLQSASVPFLRNRRGSAVFSVRFFPRDYNTRDIP